MRSPARSHLNPFCSLATRGRGFTLVEVMAVMAIVGIMLLAIVPALDQMLPGYRLNGGARAIASNMDLAQSEAISRREEVVLAYNLDQDTYWIILPNRPGDEDEDEDEDREEGLGNDPFADEPSGGSSVTERPTNDLEHGPPPPDLGRETEEQQEDEDELPMEERDALAPTRLPDDVEFNVVSVGDDEKRTGTVYVPFSHLGDDGSHVVGLKLKTEGGEQNEEIWVRFNSLTRTIEYSAERPSVRTLDSR